MMTANQNLISRARSSVAAVGVGISVSILLTASLAACGGDSNNGSNDTAAVDAPLGLDDAGLALKQTRVEELVKACMKRAGFEYVPVDPNATKAAITGSSGLTDDEFRRQFGYGISTVFEKVVEISESSQSVDPNATYRSRLDSAGQQAFDVALTGGKAYVSVSGAVAGAKAGDLEGLGGCVEEGTTAVFGGTNVISALAKIEELDRPGLRPMNVSSRPGRTGRLACGRRASTTQNPTLSMAP